MGNRPCGWHSYCTAPFAVRQEAVFEPKRGLWHAAPSIANRHGGQRCLTVLAAPATARVLRCVPQVDLTVIEPVMTTACTTRYHATMAWDQRYDTATTSTHARPRGNGPKAGNGRAVAPVLEGLRETWMETKEVDARSASARKLQPHLPLGSYFQPVAYRPDLVDTKQGLIQFTSVRRAT